MPAADQAAQAVGAERRRAGEAEPLALVAEDPHRFAAGVRVRGAIGVDDELALEVIGLVLDDPGLVALGLELDSAPSRSCARTVMRTARSTGTVRSSSMSR